MVMLILIGATALGLLAAYETGQEIQTAGYVRQSAQAQYLAEMGVMTSLESYVDMQSLVDRDLDGQVAGTPRQYEFYLQDIADDPGRWQVDPVDLAAPGVPGSFGFVEQQPDFEVRFNDGYLDATLVPRERINQLRRRVRVSGSASLASKNFAANSDTWFGRTSTTQGVLAAFSVQAELQ
jgi:hypothetical protein